MGGNTGGRARASRRRPHGSGLLLLWLSLAISLEVAGWGPASLAWASKLPSVPFRAAIPGPALGTQPVVSPPSGTWLDPPYRSGQLGYDVSFPQCPGAPGPQSASFSIIGVNDGLAFTANPCLVDQWKAASGRRSVYVNAGYNPDDAGQVTAGCAALAAKRPGADEVRQAYAIGCSEAVYSATLIAQAKIKVPLIWIDVEAMNSWDDVNLDLNRASLQGEVDQLGAGGQAVGVYAVLDDWPTIVGEWGPTDVVADWVALAPDEGQTAEGVCKGTGFSGGPVWLVQRPDTWASGEDLDQAC